MTALLEPMMMDARETVTLAELNASAALLTRVDRKYVVTTAAAHAIVAELPAAVRILELHGRRSFGYHSTYYDTPGLSSFLDAAHRRRRRFKVRVRTYLDSGERYLEVKTRRGGVTIKRRSPWSGGDALDATARRFVRAALAEEGTPAPDALEPVLDVTYDRSTFLLPDAQGRLTVDSTVAWLDRTSRALFAPTDLTIIESKSGSAPSPADRLLWRAGFRPAPVSKYATGLAALQPHLPSNRWHRVLARAPFAAHP